MAAPILQADVGSLIQGVSDRIGRLELSQTSGQTRTWRGAWSSGSAYVAGDIASDGGYYWLCVVPNSDATAPSLSSNWTLYYAKVNQTSTSASLTFTPSLNSLYRVAGAGAAQADGGGGNGRTAYAKMTHNGADIVGYREFAYIQDFGGYRNYQDQVWSQEHVRETASGVATTFANVVSLGGFGQIWNDLTVSLLATA